MASGTIHPAITIKSDTLTATTSDSGAIILPTRYRDRLIAVKYANKVGLVFDRGDGYITCKDNDCKPLANTSVTVICFYYE